VGKGAHRRFQIGVANIISRSARGLRIMGPVAAEKKALVQKAGIKGLVIEPWFGYN
jgi:hypothetical protein